MQIKVLEYPIMGFSDFSKKVPNVSINNVALLTTS